MFNSFSAQFSQWKCGVKKCNWRSSEELKQVEGCLCLKARLGAYGHSSCSHTICSGLSLSDCSILPRASLWISSQVLCIGLVDRFRTSYPSDHSPSVVAFTSPLFPFSWALLPWSLKLAGFIQGVLCYGVCNSHPGTGRCDGGIRFPGSGWGTALWCELGCGLKTLPKEKRHQELSPEEGRGPGPSTGKGREHLGLFDFCFGTL